MPRFRKGDSVRASTAGMRKYCTLMGVVERIAPHPGGVKSLDEYSIRFENGDEAICCSFQIEAASPDNSVGNNIVFLQRSKGAEADRP